MQLIHDFSGQVCVYQPHWNVNGLEGRTSTVYVPVVHIAAEPNLRIEIDKELKLQGIEVTDHLAGEDSACRRSLNQPACAVIDLDLHDVDVPSLLSASSSREIPPIILVGTCHDSRIPVRAIKAGAFDFFQKPFDPRELMTAILSAMDLDRRHAPKRLEDRELRSRMATLTPREREVLPLVVGGLLNKQAAAMLGISEITLQIHRGQVMRKMQATSLADLVRMCMKLRVRYWRPAA